MQHNSKETEIGNDLMVLHAMLEAARCGESGRELARVAAAVGELSREAIDFEPGQCGPDSAQEEGLFALERCSQEIESRMRTLAALASEYNSVAEDATSALKFEDVDSKVVVYSKPRAVELLKLAAQIEARQESLVAACASNSAEIAAMTDSFRRALREQCSKS